MVDPFDLAAGWLHETFVIPVLYAFGLMRWEELAQGWVLFVVYGAVQVVLTLAICLPLERWRPVEQWPDKHAVGVDIFYTVLSRVGVLPLVTFVLFYQVQVALNGWITDHMDPADTGGVDSAADRSFAADLRDVRRHFGLRGLLAASCVASDRMVVGAALGTSRAAADDLLVG